MKKQELAAKTLERRRAGLSNARRWVRRLRLVLALVLILLVVYVALSFRIYQLPGSSDDASPLTDVGPGETVLLLNLNLWRAPKLGDAVLYERPAEPGSTPEMLIGRVAGLPGETLRRAGPSMAVAGRDALGIGFGFGAGMPIQDGDTVPAGHYLIVADTDEFPYLDSRDFGYVPAGLIHRKVAMNLTPLLGTEGQ